MATNASRIPHAATVSGVEDPECLLQRGCRVTPTTGRILQIETSVEQPAQVPNNTDYEGVDTIQAVADRVVSEERPALPATALVTALAS